MANNYSTGNVSPSLPLQAKHLAVLGIGDSLQGEPLPGICQDDSGTWVVEDADLLFDFADEFIPEEVTPEERLEIREVLLRMSQDTRGEIRTGLSAKEQNEKDSEGRTLYYLYAEDYGVDDSADTFLRWVLDSTPDLPWSSYEYADTCDKVRPGENGGGAWFLERGKPTEWVHTGRWLEERVAALAVGEGGA